MSRYWEVDISSEQLAPDAAQARASTTCGRDVRVGKKRVRLTAGEPHVHDAVAAAGVSEKPGVVTADRERSAQIA